MSTSSTTTPLQDTPSRPEYYGVTEPISWAKPTIQDQKQTAKIIDILKNKYNLFPSEEESLKREEVLAKLDQTIKDWIKQVGMKQGLTEQLAQDAGAKLVTFGSYRLGVHSPGGDIDALCIAPRHVTRQHFFGELVEVLSKSKVVTDLQPVQDAYVPIIKMCYDGIYIDLLFARLASSMIGEDFDILNENNLKNVDEVTQRSLNGPRVADHILRLVPNIDNFRMTLKCIKLWANKRAIYGNVIGFPGGIAWALMVARICQLYPNALPNVLLSRFFRVYQQWKWPHPILLKPITEGTLGFKVWNPKVNPKDRLHLMPVITPSYPSMNSTYNVSKSTLAVMTEEFIRGAEITMKAEQGECEWDLLFEESDFFVRYKNYLEIIIPAQTESAHRAWEGFIESKLRFLIYRLEQIENMIIHPYPQTFKSTDTSVYPVSSTMYIGLKYQKKKNSGPCEVDLTPHVSEFEYQICEWPQKTAEMLKPVIRPIKRSDIPTFVLSPEAKKALLKRRKMEQKKRKAKQVPDGTSPTKKVKVEQTTSPKSTSGTVSSPPKNGPDTSVNGSVESTQQNATPQTVQTGDKTTNLKDQTKTVAETTEDDVLLGIPVGIPSKPVNGGATAREEKKIEIKLKSAGKR